MNKFPKIKKKKDIHFEPIDQMRTENVLLFNQLFNHVNTESKTLPYNIGLNIEIAVYNNTITYSILNNIVRKWNNIIFYEIYRRKINEVQNQLINLSTESKLYQLIFSQSIYPHEILDLPFTYFQPNRWKLDIETMPIVTNQYTNITSQYHCDRCHMNQCSYYELQTRSADEAMTVFITCIVCGNKWKH